METKGFNETSIVVDNNGEVSNYAAPVPESVIDEDEIVVAPISEQTERVEEEKEAEKVVAPSNETIYRIQIGSFKDALSDVVFVGVENVVPIKEKSPL